MGLEAATYITDLNTSNPVSGDDTSQGDDHLRLLKAVLQATFPNGDKAFRFPDAAAKIADYSVLATDLNKIITVDATADAATTMTLPTLAASDDGWNCRFIKIDSTANAMVIAGTINGVVNLSVITQYQFVEVHWSGTAWYATTGELDVAYLTALTAPAVGDLLTLYDLSATALRKITLENIFKIVGALTAETAIALDDLLAIYDTSATAPRAMTPVNLFKLLNLLTEDTAPALGADFVLTYDVSASTVKKVKPKNLSGFSSKLLHLQDQKAAGTVAQVMTEDSWNTREITTEVTDEITSTLSANTFTLPAGTYDADIVAAFELGGTLNRSWFARIRLYNETDGAAVDMYGIAEGGRTGLNEATTDTGSATLRGRFTIAAQKTFRIEMYPQGTGGTISNVKGGSPMNVSSMIECYLDARFWQISE
jgi:hypothetical protein